MHLQLIVIQSQPQAEITPSSMTSPGFYSLFRATEDIIQLFLFTGWVVQLVMSKTRHSHLTTSNISQSNLQKIYYTYLDMRFFFSIAPPWVSLGDYVMKFEDRIMPVHVSLLTYQYTTTVTQPCASTLKTPGRVKCQTSSTDYLLS